jgi:hypothetical protein
MTVVACSSDPCASVDKINTIFVDQDKPTENNITSVSRRGPTKITLVSVGQDGGDGSSDT